VTFLGGKCYTCQKGSTEANEMIFEGKNPTEADFEVIFDCDTCIVIRDLDAVNCSVTNDANNVVKRLNHYIPLGNKRIFYQDSMQRIDEIKHAKGHFQGFKPCSKNQADHLSKLTGLEFSN
jgi:hypothetical protein